MKNLISEPIFTTSVEFEELEKDFGHHAVKEMSNFIEVFDEQSTASLTYFYSIKDAVIAAKENFVEENGDALPAQVNVDMIVLEKDSETEPFYFVEFMQNGGSWKFGNTYASDQEAAQIFEEKSEIDTTFLHELEYQTININ